MSIIVTTTQVAANTAVAQQDITADALGVTVPSAALFRMTRTITSGTAAAHAALSVGAATSSTERWTWGCVSEDGQGTTDTERQGMTDECIFISLANGGVDGEADFVQFIPGGCRINWGNLPASAFLLTVTFIAGEHLNAQAGTFTAANAVGNSASVNLGWRPSIVILATGGMAIDAGTSTGAYHSFGVAVDDGANSQFANMFSSRDGVAASEVYGYLPTKYGCGQISAAGTGVVWTGEIAFSATGFTCTTREGASGGADDVGYLALSFNGAVDFWAGLVQLPTSTGLHSQGGPPFKPQSVLMGLTQLGNINTHTSGGDAGSFGISSFDTEQQYCDGYQDEDGQATTDTQSLSDDQAVKLPLDDGTGGHAAGFDSFFNGGWNWTSSAVSGAVAFAWALAIGEYVEPTMPPLVGASAGRAPTLCLVARQPLWIGTAIVDDNLAFKVDAISVVWTALGGYWALRFNLKGSQMLVEDWLENGLGRHIALYSHTLEPIWEGEVSSVSGNIGGMSQGRGPLLDAANRIKVIYSTVDTTVTPPAVGVREPTAWADDTDSQALYGIVERAVSIGGANATTAAQIRDTRLADFAIPRTSETDNLTSGTETSVTVECLGYVHRLTGFVYNQTVTTGLINASAKLTAILTAEPNSIFSADYGNVATNTTQVGAWENDDRDAWGLVKGIAALGDASLNRYLFGIYADRKAYYNALPTTPKFQRALSDPGQWLELFGSGGRLKPWEIEPGQWVFYTDLFAGRSLETTLRVDPRYLLIEQGEFSTPWASVLKGGDANRTDQLLAQLGLGGSGA
jgi:hypothetical protein